MKLNHRWVWVWAIAVLVIIVLSLFVAPQSSSLRQGSTYNRAPNGYGAWYAYMEAQGTPIQRWQQPIRYLAQPPAKEIRSEGGLKTPNSQSPTPNSQSLMTLLRISSEPWILGIPGEEWVRQGNVVILVGIKTPVTNAPFRSVLNSPVGGIKVETSRRYLETNSVTPSDPTPEPVLGDAYGAVVWREAIGKGQVISVSTPYLAANAYQDEPGNFKFLADLATETGYPVWVDEYIHGYQDPVDTNSGESAETLLTYLAKTPIALVAVQAIVLMLVLIWSKNRRMGPITPFATPKTDNSEAYIQAMAGVLQKANCTDFVVETVGKAEQRYVQRSLGLGTDPVDNQAILTAWAQQTGRPAAELEAALKPIANPRRMTDSEISYWLNQIQTLHRHLPG